MRSQTQTKKLVTDTCDKWVRLLLLSDHRIIYKFVNSWEGQLYCDALCDAKWQYMDHELTFHLGRVRTMTAEEIEITVVHELCHILVNEMREPDEDLKHEERVTTQLQKAFMWVRNNATVPDMALRINGA